MKNAETTEQLLARIIELLEGVNGRLDTIADRIPQGSLEKTLEQVAEITNRVGRIADAQD